MTGVVRCNTCGIALPPGWGNMYGLANDGKRITSSEPHRGVHEASQVTGMNYEQMRRAGRIGFLSFCMCFGCCHQFELDLDRDIKRCPKCSSLDIKSARGALSAKCPRCHSGIFVEAEIK
jgi:hypothetical protein